MSGEAGGTTAVLAEAAGRVRSELRRAAAGLAGEGMPSVAAEGQLIRPLVALAAAERLGPAVSPKAFWQGALAVQMVHEASLVHDDIVDGAALRRGAPTLVAQRGTAAALVTGDHLLTASYRLAFRTGSPAFARLFARSVERTVAGEIEQGRLLGQELDLARYREVAAGKSGELLGCALALAPALAGREDAERLHDLGRRLGLCYQMLDDLLDYCPGAETGKPALGDYRQRRWTWPLAELPDGGFGLEAEELLRRLRSRDGGPGPLERCLARLEAEAGAVRRDLAAALGRSELLDALLDAWLARARAGVAVEVAHAAPPRVSARLRERVPEPSAVDAHLALHSRSFHFATRLFRASERERVARVYAWCRVTDDLVDRPPEGDARRVEEVLEEWLSLSRRAYAGAPTGLPFLDRVMGEMAAAEVTFAHAADLAEGMRMDLRGEEYASLAALRVYTYRVASVVGLWVSGLAGVREPEVLERASALGHAMQLTNILRDVGEDLDRGRLYLPLEAMERHGVDVAELRARRRVTPGYRALVEELMGAAEADYARAFEAIPRLPRAYRRPVAVAALVYRGIHDGIRANGYDNLGRRARTSPAQKLRVAGRALWQLRRATLQASA